MARDAAGKLEGPRFEQVGRAHDLCSDAWPDKFKQEVEAYLRLKMHCVFFDQTKCSRSGRIQIVINGERVEHEQVVTLQEGYYPFLVGLRLGAKWQSVEPWFEVATEEDLAKCKAKMPAMEAEYLAALKESEQDEADWKRLGGANSKLWLWQAGDLSAVKCAGNQFTITRGDATLTGTYSAATLTGRPSLADW